MDPERDILCPELVTEENGPREGGGSCFPKARPRLGPHRSLPSTAAPDIGSPAQACCRAVGAQSRTDGGGREGLPSPHGPSPPPAPAQHPSRETGISCGRAPEAQVSERGGEGSGSAHKRPLASIPSALAARRPRPVCLKLHHWRVPLWVRCCLQQIFSECLLCTRRWEHGGKYVDLPLREYGTVGPRTVNRQLIIFCREGGNSPNTVSHSHFSMNESFPCFPQSRTGPEWLHALETGVQAGGQSRKEQRNDFPQKLPQLPSSQAASQEGPPEALPGTHPHPARSRLLLPPYPLPEASPSPPSWKRFCCLRRSCVTACEL